MPILPTIRGKNAALRNTDDEAKQHLLLHQQSPKPQVGPLSSPPESATLKSPFTSPVASEPHHSPAGYRTPPEEKRLRELARGPNPPPPTFAAEPPQQQQQQAVRVRNRDGLFERLGDSIEEAVHHAHLKHRFQHNQPQQQIGVLPPQMPTAGGVKAEVPNPPQLQQLGLQNGKEQRADELWYPRQRVGHPRAQQITPALPNVAAAAGDAEKTSAAAKKFGPTPLGGHGLPAPAGLGEKREEAAAVAATRPAPPAASKGPQAAGEAYTALSSPGWLWNAVEGAAAALSRLRIGVPHAPVVVTPTTAPMGFSFEEVDGHHQDDPNFRNPPDAAALVESEAAREEDAAEAAGTAAGADATPRSRILDAIVAGISRFGVLGIHYPVGIGMV